MIRLFVCFLLVVLAGCNSKLPEPKQLRTDTKPILATIDSAKDSLSSAVTKIDEGVNGVKAATQGKVDVEQPLQKILSGRSDVQIAKTELATVTGSVAMLQKDIDSNRAQFNQLAEQLDKSKRNEAAAIERAKEANDKYEESWFGGKFWRLVTWVTTITIILLVVGLVVNAKTNFFVYPVKFFSWLFKHDDDD